LLINAPTGFRLTVGQLKGAHKFFCMCRLHLCNIIAQKMYNIKEMNILTNKTTDLGLVDGTEKLGEK
jgi:hypothetical protein